MLNFDASKFIIYLDVELDILDIRFKRQIMRVFALHFRPFLGVLGFEFESGDRCTSVEGTFALGNISIAERLRRSRIFNSKTSFSLNTTVFHVVFAEL